MNQPRSFIDGLKVWPGTDCYISIGALELEGVPVPKLPSWCTLYYTQREADQVNEAFRDHEPIELLIDGADWRVQHGRRSYLELGGGLPKPQSHTAPEISMHLAPTQFSQDHFRQAWQGTDIWILGVAGPDAGKVYVVAQEGGKIESRLEMQPFLLEALKGSKERDIGDRGKPE